jgi:hypothetical protein
LLDGQVARHNRRIGPGVDLPSTSEMGTLVKVMGYFDNEICVYYTGNIKLRAKTACNSQGIAISMSRPFANSSRDFKFGDLLISQTSF